MTEDEREVDRETLASMVETVAPAWTVEGVHPARAGIMAVYRLEFAGPDAPAECYLKATLDDDQGVALEARILSLLGAHTRIPVPSVYGAVDAHPALPAPYFLMESMPGTTISRPEIGTLSDDVLATIARETGRSLAHLHAIDAVDGFGFLEVTGDAGELRGEVPPADPASVAVVDPTDDWRTYLGESVAGALAALEEGHFGDLVPSIRSSIDDGVDELEGPFEPALAHVDASIENVRFVATSGEVTALLDWAFTIAAAPAYDLAFVEQSLSGGPWWFVPSTPDRRPLIREALLEGYREAGSTAVVDRVQSAHDLYDLVATTHSMLHAEDRLQAEGATADQIEGARRRHREVVEDLV